MAASCKMNTNYTKYNLSDWDSERYVDQLISESDDTYFACPTFDSEPDLLLSKVRQHYMKHMVKLLSVNYETNQKLLNKNIYLPSGIWRCAKIIEMKAAQRSMVIELYRTDILTVIKEVKKSTEKGKLYRNLLDTLRTPPNDKKTQTSIGTSTECNCKCHDNDSKRRRKSSPQTAVDDLTVLLQGNTSTNTILTQYKIPVALNMQTHTPEPVLRNVNKINTLQSMPNPTSVLTEIHITESLKQPTLPIQTNQNNKTVTPINTENDSDDIMMQLEKLFHTDQTDDDLFEGSFNNVEPKNMLQNDTTAILQESMNKVNDSGIENPPYSVQPLITNNLVIENHAAQIRSLDERLATLTGILINNDINVPEQKQEKICKNVQKEKELKKKKMVSKWHCEEYFLKKHLLETLYQIGDYNRNKLTKIKTLFIQLFGPDDDDDEEILSPIEERPELVSSCKTRITMWVLTTLTPYYGMGRIRGKTLFKSVVKYLIDLIIKCKQYPDKREVTSFVQDFIQNHAIIACEADYRVNVDNAQAPYTFA